MVTKKEIQKFANSIENCFEVYDDIKKEIVDIDISFANKLQEDDSIVIDDRKVLLKNLLYKIISKQKEDVGTIHLNKLLKKRYENVENLSKIIKKCKLANRNIGKIPRCFFKNIDMKDRKTAAINIFKLFRDYSLVLNCCYFDKDYSNKNLSRNLEKFSKLLETIILQEVKIVYLGNGFNGNVFKIELECNKKICYKVFFPYKLEKKLEDMGHGSIFEPKLAYFASNNSRKGQFSKFYFGRIALEQDIDAYIVSEYLESSDEKNIDNNTHIDYLDILDDKFSNKINGKIVDYGSIYVKNTSLSNRELRKLTRILSKCFTRKKDDTILRFSYSISAANLQTLRNFLMKTNFTTFLKAVNVLDEKYCFPKEFKKDLLNIQIHDKTELFELMEIDYTSFFNMNLKELENLISLLDLDVVTKALPINETTNGHYIIKLTKYHRGIFYFNNDGNIERVIIKDNKTGKPITILDLF